MFQGRALFRIDKGRLLILPNEGRSVWLETRVGAALKVSARETGDSFSALELVHHSWFYCSSARSLKRRRGYLRYRGRNRREDTRSSGHRAVRVLRFQAQKCPSHFLESRDKGRTDTRDDSTARFCKPLKSYPRFYQNPAPLPRERSRNSTRNTV